VLFTWGEKILPPQNATYGIACDSLFLKNGLQNGDKILTVEGEVPEDLFDINRMILLHNARHIEVDRNGEKKMVVLPQDIDYKMVGAGARGGILPRQPSVIDSVVAGRNGEKAGFKKGDSIVTVNDQPAIWYNDFNAYVNRNLGKTLTIGLYRNNELKSITVKVDKDTKIGLWPKDWDKVFAAKKINYGFFESIPAGFSFGAETLSNYVISLKFLFTKEGASQISGFGGIGSMFSPSWDWHSFWMLTAFLSMVLAFMNILPIPALDGGHVMFLIWEMVTGRPPRQKVLEYAQIVGMVILFGLILYANGNDLFKWIFG